MSYGFGGLIDVEKDDGALVTIDYIHTTIHEGKSYFAGHIFTGIANDASAMLRVKNGSTKELHLTISLATGGSAYIYTYIGTTYSADGTAITPVNRMIAGSASTASVYHTPTVNVLGTRIAESLNAGGTGPQSAGGTSSSRAEVILAPNTDILCVATNKSGQTKDMFIVYDWYEE